MRKAIILMSVLAAVYTSLPAQTDSLALDTTLILNEITVNGVRIINKVDRQIYIPSKTIVKHSSNGYDLLDKLSLNGIKVNTAERKISSTRGGDVQIRINDIKAELQDIISLLPDEVIRVEYIDNPGVRYSDDNLAAVINYVVKRRYSGCVGGVSTDQAFTTGFNNTDAYFKFNYKKSEFSINYDFSYREYDKRRYSSYTTYNFPDGTRHDKNYIGLNTPFMYATNDFRLAYNLAEPDKYTLNIAFKFNNYNSPKRGVNKLVEETGQPDLYLFNKIKDGTQTPAIDIYYSLNMPHNQNIALNAVGTYIGTDYAYQMKDYLYENSAEQSMQSSPLNDYSYAADGKKYSLITEAIYSKTMKKEVLSAGAEYTISHTNNDYTGNVNTDAVLNSQKLYFFAQLQGSLWKLNYSLGVGASYNRVYQDDTGFDKWTFRPQLSLKYSPSKNTSIRLSSRLSEITPSLSDLSDVRQQQDELTANDGNPYVRPWWQNNNSLSFDWNTDVFSLNYYCSLSYSSRPIASSIYPELQDDGSYMIITKTENQKSFFQSYEGLDFTLHAIKDVLDLRAYGSFSTFRSRGNNYLHTYNHWQGGCSANLMLGNWDVVYAFGTAGKSLWGENIYGGENTSTLAASYKYKGFEAGLGVLLLGYAKGYDYYDECLSRYYKSVGHTYIKNNGNMIYFSLAYKFSYGRKYNAGSRRLYNRDNDNGVK